MIAPLTGTFCANGKLRITRTRWQVDNQIVQIAPFGVIEQAAQAPG